MASPPGQQSSLASLLARERRESAPSPSPPPSPTSRYLAATTPASSSVLGSSISASPSASASATTPSKSSPASSLAASTGSSVFTPSSSLSRVSSSSSGVGTPPAQSKMARLPPRRAANIIPSGALMIVRQALPKAKPAVVPPARVVPGRPPQFTGWRDERQQQQSQQQNQQPQQRQQQQRSRVPRSLPDPLFEVPDLIARDLVETAYCDFVTSMQRLTIDDADTEMAGAAPNPFATATTATPAPSNPFTTAFQQQQKPTSEPAFNPFSKPQGQPAFGTALSAPAKPATPAAPVFGNGASSSTANAAKPENPFQRGSSPFGQPSQPANPQPASNPFLNSFQPSSQPAGTPAATGVFSKPAAAAPSPFGQTPLSTPAATLTPTAPSQTLNGGAPIFGSASQQQQKAAVPFGQANGLFSGVSQQPATAFGGLNPVANTFVPIVSPMNSAATVTPFAPFTPSALSSTVSSGQGPSSNVFGKPAAPTAPAARKVRFNVDGHANAVSHVQPPPASNGINKSKGGRDGSSPQPPAGPSGPQSDYAKQIYDRLRKDNVRPPNWPGDPGNPDKRAAMESFRENYKAYREKVRSSLIRGGLIDDPDVRKRLDEAIDFKGICEDMCPDFERITRIVQYDVKMPEKAAGKDGTQWPSPPLMVKALARSAAGQEAPLPMDVRSVAALKRTLNYLVDTVLGDDSRLPTMHNFLWDRTRAIRRDFVFHSTMSGEEMRQQVYCLENITRFHATALHLLSQSGFAADDFSEQQEREQLGKALLSLMQAYDDCKDKDVDCPQEAEFRAYFILLNAHDPDFQHKVTEWGSLLWYSSDEVQTALTLVQTMQSIWDYRGPIKPGIPNTTALGAFTTFFRIVESPDVSYTMACMAEIHFLHVRRGILKNMARAYARARDSPKDLTLKVLNGMLRFDTEDEAFDFISEHGLEFSSPDGGGEPHLVLERHTYVGSPTIRQSFSQALVERKRGDRPLPKVIHETVFENGSASGSASSSFKQAPARQSSNSLFVDKTEATIDASASKGKRKAVDFGTTTAPAATSSPFTRPTPFTTPSISLTAPSSAATSSTASQPTQTPLASAFSPGTAPSSSSQLDTQAKRRDVEAPKETPSFFPQPGANKRPQPPAAGSSPFNPFSTTPTLSSTAAATAGPDTKRPAPGPVKASSILDANTSAGPASNRLFAPPASKSQPATQPAGSSFSSLFPSGPASTVLGGSASTADATPKPTPASSIPSPKAVEELQKQKSLPGPTSKDASAAAQATIFAGSAKSAATQPSSSSPGISFPPATAGQTAQQKSSHSAMLSSAPTPASAPKAPAAKADPMDGFAKWFVLGDGGIMEDFRNEFVRHLVHQTLDQFQQDEEERLRKEEDAKSWAEALKFKTYNLSVKYFYRWRDNARDRALDRRAREARDQLKAYQANKRAERRQAAEKAAAQKREKAAQELRTKRKVKFWESIGYPGGFDNAAATPPARKRKASVDAENDADDTADRNAAAEAILATGILRGVRDEHETVDGIVQEALHPVPVHDTVEPDAEAEPEAERETPKTPHTPEPALSQAQRMDRHMLNEHRQTLDQLRQEKKEKNSLQKEHLPLADRHRSPRNVLSSTMGLAKDRLAGTIGHRRTLTTPSASPAIVNNNKRGRASLDSLDGLDDADGRKRRASVESIRSARSTRSSHSPELGDQVAYYRRSIPGRAGSIYTRVPPPPRALPSSASPNGRTPKKETNFSRVSKKRWSLGDRRASVDRTASPSLDSANSANGVHGVHGTSGLNGKSSLRASLNGGSLYGRSSPSPSSSSAAAATAGTTGHSHVRSSYWKLRSMGLVQMPNKAYLHESLALPMLREGKRFAGIGSYGLPPVPAWEENGQKNQTAEAHVVRKRLYSGSSVQDADNTDDVDGSSSAVRPDHADSGSNASNASSSSSSNKNKKTKLLKQAADAPSSRPTSGAYDPGEAERVIQEMRAMADAMDQGRDWFKEQTDMMQKGQSPWE